MAPKKKLRALRVTCRERVALANLEAKCRVSGKTGAGLTTQVAAEVGLD
jgi:hypothetical protein